MSERIKLQDPGSSVTLHGIKTVTAESINNTDYFKFDDGVKELLVPASSMASRYTGLGVANAQQMAGMSITFSRSTKLSKFGKPFWDCARAEDVRGAPQAASNSAPTPTAATTAVQVPTEASERVSCIDRAYHHAYQVAKHVQGPDSTPEALTAGAALLHIAYGKEGLMSTFAKPKPKPVEEEDEFDGYIGGEEAPF